ncbi:hypothetical protein PspLS_10334 [Pyricularia sp. CBS 133598]|nr:hypothetical protein PspLS_10334 [Pyricularia sp. CBS 133598]
MYIRKPSCRTTLRLASGTRCKSEQIRPLHDADPGANWYRAFPDVGYNFGPHLQRQVQVECMPGLEQRGGVDSDQDQNSIVPLHWLPGDGEYDLAIVNVNKEHIAAEAGLASILETVHDGMRDDSTGYAVVLLAPSYYARFNRAKFERADVYKNDLFKPTNDLSVRVQHRSERLNSIDSLCFAETACPSNLPPNHVEVEVQASGLKLQKPRRYYGPGLGRQIPAQ